jgi:hypothetical protein
MNREPALPAAQATESQPDDALLILVPIYDDWAALARLTSVLDSVLSDHGTKARLLVVDDGSSARSGWEETGGRFAALSRIDILELRRNLGHQRAIAIGLAYVEDQIPCEAVVVMDGDGEDDPHDVPRLLERCRQDGGQRIVFAGRARRSESWVFRVFYGLFRLVHFVLTGHRVLVGNFSIIPRARLESLVVVAEMWNHYAAAAFKSRQPYCIIPTERARRLDGESSMNFVQLVVHGLSAISVYSETVGVRLLIAAFGLALFSLSGLLATVVVRLSTDWGIPGWATSTAGIFLVLLSQAVMLAFVFSFVTLSNRHGSTFLPRRDYAPFIGRLWTVNLEPCAITHTSDPSSSSSPGRLDGNHTSESTSPATCRATSSK